MAKSLGIYIHIPFCRQKCLYCDFCSWPACTDSQVIRYVHALCDEIIGKSRLCKDYVVDTVYFGGGTPTLLPTASFRIVLETIREYYEVSEKVEITAECNPATVDEKYLRELHKIGVNRLSIGVQSLQDTELSALGRIHNSKDARDTFDYARKAGFDNISVDLMFGIPRQTQDSFEKSVEEILVWQPEHVSVYGLILEEGTPFWENKDELSLPDEDSERFMYMKAMQTFERHGYEQYEISNLSKPGYRSAHNYRYWDMQDYIGFGVAAHSLLGGRRFYHDRDFDSYLENPCGTQLDETLTDKAFAEEYIMMRMRLTDGVSWSEFENRTHISAEPYRRRLAKYVQPQLVQVKNDGNSFTREGFYVSNAILSEILDFDE